MLTRADPGLQSSLAQVSMYSLCSVLSRACKASLIKRKVSLQIHGKLKEKPPEMLLQMSSIYQQHEELKHTMKENKKYIQVLFFNPVK